MKVALTLTLSTALVFAQAQTWAANPRPWLPGVAHPPQKTPQSPWHEPNNYIPYNTHTSELEDFPDTAIPGAGYMQCPSRGSKLPGACHGADAVNYRLEATEKVFKVSGSRLVEATTWYRSSTGADAVASIVSILKILPWLDSNRTAETIAKTDVKFFTRTFQAMKDQGPKFNKRFCPYGADGWGTLLGPCLMVEPGQKLNILMKNDLHGGKIHIKNVVPTKMGYWLKMKNLFLSQNNVFARDIMGIGSSTITLSTLFPSQLSTGDLGFEKENVPGWATNKSWDVFNVHLHGMEVAPHLFDPMGTSDPASDYISIQPNAKYKQQCYCYKFHVSPAQSRGVFIWHTHRHGTTSMTTWGGMFGVIMTDVVTVAEASALLKAKRRRLEAKAEPAGKARPSGPTVVLGCDTSELCNLVELAEEKGLTFTDADIIPFVIWNTKWRFKGINNELTANNPFGKQTLKADATNRGEVELNNFLPNQMPCTAIDPFLVNDAYQPTYPAVAGHMTLMRIVCLSTEWMCGFQLYSDDTKMIVPFYTVAGDGITWPKPHYHNAGMTLPISVNEMGLFEVSDAYLLLGGGNRQDILVQFPHAGTYTAYQITFAGQSSQKLGTINVTQDPALRCGGHARSACKEKDLSNFDLKAARKSEMDRKVTWYRNVSFAQELNRTVVPYVQWGVADRQQSQNESIGGFEVFQEYKYEQVNMVLQGSDCAIWDICSRNPINHPFHVHVNPFQILDIYETTYPGVISCVKEIELVFKHVNAMPLFRHWKGEWRDTAWVPPCGCLKIQMCYDAGAPSVDGGPMVPFEGKFVFHCHFLTHEDTGLIHNVMLRNKNFAMDPTNNPAKFPGAVCAADNSACPSNDPCGVLPRTKGCTKCPDITWKVEGCVCMQPLPKMTYDSPSLVMQPPGKMTHDPHSLMKSLGLPMAKFDARSVRGASAGTMLGMAALVGAVSAGLAFGVLLTVQRAARVRYAAASPDEDEAIC